MDLFTAFGLYHVSPTRGFGLSKIDCRLGCLLFFASPFGHFRLYRNRRGMSNKIFINLRFNLDFRQEGAVPGSKLGEQVGFKNANQGPQADGIPIISPGGYFGIGQTRSLPILRIQNTFNPRLDFTKLNGKHSLKFGFEVRRRRQITQFQTNRGNGRFNYARTFSDDPNNAAATGETMAAFLLGAPSLIEQDFTLVFPDFRYTE